MRAVPAVTAALVALLGYSALLPVPGAFAQPAPAATAPPGAVPNETPIGNAPTPAEMESVVRDAPFEGGAPVIPAGQEGLLGEMLGLGAVLPGDCKFSGGGAEAAAVRATYACPGGEVVVELRHRGDAPGGAAQTAQFAVIVQSGSPPAGFADALATRIREREARFQWKWTGRPAAGERHRVLPLAAGALAVLVVLAWLWRRRAAGRSTSG